MGGQGNKATPGVGRLFRRMPTPAGPRNCYRVPARPGVRCIPGSRLDNATLLAGQATSVFATFAMYLVSLLDGSAKLVLFTVIPAAFVGAVPAELVRVFRWHTLVELLAAALVLMALAPAVFARGLRRYESGSGIPAQT